MAYGGDAPISALHRGMPELRVMSRATLKQCVLRYAGIGWSGHIPAACHNTLLLVPANVGPWLWGWPHRFVDRMQHVSTEVFVTGRYGGSGFSSGIDTADNLAMLPPGAGFGIWTNRIDRIAPLVRSTR